jgi:flavin reductase (DIM6/NTAB) family NADH-FMN oxidoreductase RutF
MKLHSSDIQQMDSKVRLNLINSIGGIKPANLIGTRSKLGRNNLAIFFSVMHIQSSPPLVGIMIRPDAEVRRDTWNNIQETKLFTINSITENMAERAHYTSAKFPEDLSEFDACHFQEEYLDDFKIPYVSESPIKMGLEMVDHYKIKASGTTLVIGEIKHIYLPDGLMDKRGYINFESIKGVGISGLNSYYKLQKAFEFPYARAHEIPDL